MGKFTDFDLELNIISEKEDLSRYPSLNFTCLPCVISQWKCPSLNNPKCTEGCPNPPNTTWCPTVSDTDMGACNGFLDEDSPLRC